MISSLEKRVPMSLLWGSVKIWNIDLQEHLIRLVYCEIKNKQPKILLSESLTIESIDREACSAFFERLRSVDQKNANDIAICLPEKNLLIKPLPTYPYLKKKELRQALSVYQEQILPRPTRNQTCAYCILPENEIQRKKENRCSGLLYVLDHEPYQDFFDLAQEYGYHIKKICFRAYVYYLTQSTNQTEGLLFMLEFFKERIRCHLFQNGIITHYRDFNFKPTSSELLIEESLEKALCSYIRYFIAPSSERTSIQTQLCISEESENLNNWIDSITKEMSEQFLEMTFLPSMTFRQTLESLTTLITIK